MEPLGVVEFDVSPYALLQFCHGFIVLEKNVFILEGPPESLDVDIVQRPVDTVHADCYAPGFQNIDEGFGRELAALVGVENSRDSVAVDRLLQGGNAELRIHSVGEPPTQDAPGKEIDDGYQIHETGF